MSATVGGERLGRRVDHVDAVAGQRGPDPAQLGQAALGGGRGVQRAGAVRGRRRARPGPGRARRRRTTVWRDTRLGSTGSRPSPSAPGSSVVNSTTSARLRSRRQHLGDDPAEVGLDQRRLQRRQRVEQPGQATAWTRRTRWRGSACRRPAGRPGRRRARPGWPAAGRRRWRCRGAARRRPRVRAGAAAGAMRPALVRPVSMTHSTRRSRSGRHCLTTTCSRRALPRQSIERGSSPMT